MTTIRGRLAWCAAIALLAAACGADPGGEGAAGAAREETVPDREVPAKVFVVAIDGASWDVLDPAMAAGTLPNLERMVREGARGTLTSMDPTASAILWTTIATGKTPDKHGIRSFLGTSASGKTVPVSSNMRRVKALWNIASEGGVRVGFLGWWVTWPAETVRGFMASDYTWPLRKDAQGFATGSAPEISMPGRTYPEELLEELRPHIWTEANTPPEILHSLGVTRLPQVRGYAVRDMLLKDVSLGAMVGPLLASRDPQLFAVYFDGFDAYAHIFWPVYRDYAAARAAGGDVLDRMDPRRRAIGEVMAAHLTRIDEALGTVLDHAGPDDVVLVISDHGYGDVPDGEPVLRGYDEWIRVPHWHTLRGVVAARGGPVRAGATIEGGSVLDVTPTVLALLGLPVAEDMDGRVLTGMLSDAFLAANAIETVETYETGDRRGGDALESEYDEEVIERLRSLGYVD